MIFLTGGSGLLGGHLLEQGIQLQKQMRLLVRKPLSRSAISRYQDQVELVTADLLDPGLEAQIAPALSGVATIIHSAALASSNPADAERMEEHNLRATQNLFQIAKKSGVKNWLQISSLAALGKTESGILREGNFQDFRDTAYGRSKWKTDRWLDEQSGMQVTRIYPGFMLGRWDARPSSGAILLALKMKKISGFVDTGRNFVAASDVARGIWQAIDAKADGDFILGGENLQIAEFLEKCCRALEIDFTALNIFPSWSAAEREVRDEKELHFLKEFCWPSVANSDHAQRTFGYAPQKKISEAIEEALEYFADQRLLRKFSPRRRLAS